VASAHIEIPSTASRLSADARSAIDRLEQLQDDFGNIKNIMDQVALGGDWAALAIYLGVTAEEAESVYNLWGSGNTEISATFLSQIVARLGGGDS